MYESRPRRISLVETQLLVAMPDCLCSDSQHPSPLILERQGVCSEEGVVFYKRNTETSTSAGTRGSLCPSWICCAGYAQ